MFDLDGTLLDSVYQHVLSWREALETQGIRLSVWRIHRRIGMSGGLLTQALLRETGRPLGSELAKELQQAHAEAYARRMDQVRPLPGAQELLDDLTDRRIPWAIATSGRQSSASAVHNCHANFSFLDGASHPEDLVETAVELGYQAPAVTDHNGFYGVHPTGRCIGRAFSTTPRLLAAG